MTALLEQAISQIQQLPPDQQDANDFSSRLRFASRFLAECQDEQQWENQFAATTDDQWDQMATMVRQEIESRKTAHFR